MNNRTAIDGVRTSDIFGNTDLAQTAMLPLYVGLILTDSRQQLLAKVGSQRVDTGLLF